MNWGGNLNWCSQSFVNVHENANTRLDIRRSVNIGWAVRPLV